VSSYCVPEWLVCLYGDSAVSSFLDSVDILTQIKCKFRDFLLLCLGLEMNYARVHTRMAGLFEEFNHCS